MVESADLEGEASESLRIDRDVVGDVEVHLLRDYWEMANRRFGLRYQFLHAQIGRLNFGFETGNTCRVMQLRVCMVEAVVWS